MDGYRFDSLVRLLGTASSRRATLGAVIGAALAGVVGETAAKRKGIGRGKNRHEGGNGARKDRKKGGKTKGRNKAIRRGGRTRAEAAPARCFTGSPCIPGPGKNLGKCDFGGTSALRNKNLKGANLGSANLAGADASGANLQGANLDKACLVEANLTGAAIDGSTSIATAVFCRTIMPDGSLNNAKCNKDSACCSTCGENGKPCCAGNACDAGLVCAGGTCLPCGGAGQPCCPGAECNGALVCNGGGTCVVCGIAGNPCCPTGGGADDPGTCNGGLLCTVDDLCVPCGSAVGQPCCPVPNSSGICDADARLVCSFRDGNTCVACGGDTEPCCEDGRNTGCDTGFVCTSTIPPSGRLFCFPCGGDGQRCCANRACGAGLTCGSAGICRRCPGGGGADDCL